MAKDASGYITEIGYPHFYFPELALAWLSLAALNGRVGMRAAKPLRYLELGFGQGLSLNVHAAACPGEYWGVDVNPAHVANAKAMADASGSGLHILETSFAAFLARQDVPKFDVIVANGVWTWVSPANRAAIVDIVRGKLADGGIFYMSYNCTPGWSAVMPLRHLLSLHANLAESGSKGILDKVDGAIDFAQRVADTGAGYFKANQAAAQRLKAIKTQDRAYVAHEFFHDHWAPMPFSQVAGLLAPANVSFAASGNLLHQSEDMFLSPECRKLLDEIHHPILRESVRDYLANAQYRQDIFVKGGKPMTKRKQEHRYLAQGFVLKHAAVKFPVRVGGLQAVIAPTEDFYQSLIDVLAENSYAPQTLRELSSHRRLQDTPLPRLIAALIIFTGAGILCPTQDAEAIRQARPRCKALNAHLSGTLPAEGKGVFLASPVSGAGIAVKRSELLFMQALQAGRACAEDWARYAWDNFYSKEIASRPDSGPSAAHEENLAALTTEAHAFAAKRLPILRALEVA